MKLVAGLSDLTFSVILFRFIFSVRSVLISSLNYILCSLVCPTLPPPYLISPISTPSNPSLYPSLSHFHPFLPSPPFPFLLISPSSPPLISSPCHISSHPHIYLSSSLPSPLLFIPPSHSSHPLLSLPLPLLYLPSLFPLPSYLLSYPTFSSPISSYRSLLFLPLSFKRTIKYFYFC